MSIFSNLFASIESNFAAWFATAEAETLDFLKPLAASIVANGGAILTGAVTAAVAAAETSGGTGLEKLAAATAAVKTELESKGTAFVASTVNGAIEAAVAALPKQVAAIAAAVVSPTLAALAPPAA